MCNFAGRKRPANISFLREIISGVVDRITLLINIILKFSCVIISVIREIISDFIYRIVLLINIIVKFLYVIISLINEIISELCTL